MVHEWGMRHTCMKGTAPGCLMGIPFEECFMKVQAIANNSLSVAVVTLDFRNKRPHIIEMCLQLPTLVGSAPPQVLTLNYFHPEALKEGEACS